MGNERDAIEFTNAIFFLYLGEVYNKDNADKPNTSGWRHVI